MFKALDDPQRRSILRALRRGEAASGALAERLGISPATVSHHLALLKQAGLVRVRRDGRHRRYTLNVSVLEESLLVLVDLLKPREEPKP